LCIALLDHLSFTQVTNTIAKLPPRAGTTTTNPFIGDDNHDASIDDNGETIAFASIQDLVPPRNSGIDANDEIFIYKRLSNSIVQVTQTPYGQVSNPVYNITPSISGNGRRVVFISSTTNPINGMSGGCNPDFSEEVYFSDLNDFGEPDGIKRQVTITTRIDYNGETYLEPATRTISRDGRYIIVTSRARITTDNAIDSAFTQFIYDSEISPSPSPCQNNPNQFRQMLARGNTDPGLPTNQGDRFRYATFTDYNPNTLAPGAVVFSSKMNFRVDGSVPPSGSSEGLNPNPQRPGQVYSFSLAPSSAPFTRLTNSSTMNTIYTTRTVASNSKNRLSSIFVDNLTATSSEKILFYINSPNAIQEDPAPLNFYTGASFLSINTNPQQADGLTPNMLGSVVFLSPNISPSVGIATNVSNSRNFIAPLQLQGVSLTIDGVAANITRVMDGQINFIVPKELTSGNKSVVINHNGIVLRGSVNILGYSQPDILTRQRDNITEIVATAYGRARILNVTDPNNPQSEPFPTTTQTPAGTVPTKLRIFLTGVRGVNSNSISIKFGNITVPNTSITTNAVETDYPGVFSFDFDAPPQLY
jgi:uncharacterized protein (TIGR03437 family)